MDFLKKSLKIVSIFIAIIISLIFIIYIGDGISVAYKKNIATQTAKEYITETYPDFQVVSLKTEYQWKSNAYVVTYTNKEGVQRQVTIDHTCKKLQADDYILRTARQVIFDYTDKIKNIIEIEISQKVKKPYYVNVNLYKDYNEMKDIVLNGKDIINEAVDCTIGFTNYDGFSKEEFVELVIQSVKVIRENNLNIRSVDFVSQNGPNSRYDLKWNDYMADLSNEELVQYVK